MVRSSKEHSLHTQVLVTISASVETLDGAVQVVHGPIGAAPEAVGLLVGPTDRVGHEELAHMRNLRVVAVAGAGTDGVDVDALRERCIKLVSAPNATAEATAELTLCLALMTSRGVPAAVADLTAGTWTGWSFDHIVGRGLRGLTLGLVGFGRIGRRVAELASAFGMNVIHHARRNTEVPGYIAGLGTLLSSADIVSVHVPLTPETDGLIGPMAIKSMRPGAALINTSRGGIVDEEALVEALTTGRLSGACLDVFAGEPDTPLHLLGVPNLLMTPHIGTSTRDARSAMADEASKKLLHALQQERNHGTTCERSPT